MDDDSTIKLAVRSLLEIVQTGAKNIEIAIMGPDAKLKSLDASEVEAIVATIEQENAAEACLLNDNAQGGSEVLWVLVQVRPVAVAAINLGTSFRLQIWE
ncbi:hypothetical protein DFJ73DRAFT_957576 [Zopfochytrium polystomum]|nr:hypothetical protein DFJ73DRAFT_957576 [Zopfochytrium polystomum]